MKETELAKYFVEYLSCYDLYFEVDYYNCIDIVAMSNSLSSAIEVKTSFNFKVLEQAINNKKYFNFSYIAVPDFKDSHFQEQLCKDYGVGLLLFREHYYRDEKVIQVVAPKLNRHVDNKKLRKRLCDRHKLSLAGSKNGDGTKITAFGVTVDSLVRYVSIKEGCSIKEAIENTNHHYRTDTLAISSIRNWIKSGVIKEVYVENRKLYIKK